MVALLLLVAVGGVVQLVDHRGEHPMKLLPCVTHGFVDPVAVGGFVAGLHFRHFLRG